MTAKSLLKLFIPPIILKIRDCFSFTKNSFVSTIADIRKKDDILIVLGNGPSLNKSLKEYKDKISAHDNIVVNYFCESEYYGQLKPSYYLIADPVFFGEIDTFAEWQREKVRRLIDAIVVNTKWNINLIVPSIAIGSEFMARVKENTFIHTYFYNNVDTCKREENLKFVLWDKNLLSPPAMTCLNTCVWLGVFLRYREVYIIGADSNWVKLHEVDQETNVVYMNDAHFYGQKKVVSYRDSEGKIPIKMHEALFCVANAFKLYWDLREYAEYAKVKVYNASEYSLIDAFERKKLG